MRMAEHVNLCGNTGYTVCNGHSRDTENLHGEPWKLMPLFAQTEAHSPPEMDQPEPCSLLLAERLYRH